MQSSFDAVSIEPIRNSEASNSELVNEHRMNGAFVIRAGVASHQELSSRDEDHFGFDDHWVAKVPVISPVINEGADRVVGNFHI